MRSKSRARTPISSRPRRSVRARLSPSRMPVGDGADTVEPAHDGAAQQEADERAERERRAEAEQREPHPVGGAGAVERREVVVQLEHRVRPGTDRVMDLGVVPAGRAHVAVGLLADVDRRSLARGRPARLRDAGVPVDVVPRDGDLAELGVALLQADDALLHQLRVGEVADPEPVLPGRRDRDQLAAGGALVGAVDRVPGHAHHQRGEQQDAAEHEHGDPGAQARQRVQAAHTPSLRLNGPTN